MSALHPTPQTRSSSVRWLVTVVAAWVALLSGCASTQYPLNPPIELTQGKAPAKYDIAALDNADNSVSMFVHLSLSGGGTRAAAMSFGVLEALAATQVEWDGRRRNLFEEIDVVSGVSGGSIAGAYLALAGPRFLRDFPDRFLYQNFQGELIGRVLKPSNLWRLSSPRYGRSELVAQLLDEKLFEGATFQRLIDARRRPLFIGSATDITDGSRFEFSRLQFDALCSDLAQLPISRAVAASMAVPIVFSPIALRNHASTCPVPVPKVEGTRKASYSHLLDGGLSDNLGVRAPLAYVHSFGGIKAANASAGGAVKKLVFIIVNARTEPKFPEDQSPDVPGIVRSIAAVSDIPINRFSQESSREMQLAVARWREELNTPQDPDGKPATQIYLISLSFNDVEDEKEREYLLSLPTSLTLPREDVDRVRRAAANQLKRSPEFQRLLGDIQLQTNH